MRFDVVTFGGAVVDSFVETGVNEKNNLISFPVGSKLVVQGLKIDIGGGGTNSAVAFSRFGFKTGFIGKIGDDDNGKEILNMLKKERVKFLGKIGKGVGTGSSVILTSKERSRTVLKYSGVNDELKFSEVPRKIKTKWLYLSSVLGNSFKTQKKLARILHRKGVKIAFNPSEYLIKRENLKSLLEICEVVSLNKEEARMLVKKSDLLKGLYELGCKKVVITDKNKLISCYNGKKKYFLKPHKIKVVERTGAGDAFASGFVAGQIAGKSVKSSLKLGLIEGESVLRHFGAKNKLLMRRLM